jgi:DNA-binding transcriptional MocR family regulator
VAGRAAGLGLQVETLAYFAAERPAPEGFALGYGLIEAERIGQAIQVLREAIGSA